MKKYFLLTFFLPLFGLAQECTTVIPTNNNADSIVYCVTNTTCYDTCNGVISITVHGDNHPYSFEWFNNSTPWPGVSIQDTLCPSDYIITITDVNGNLVDNSHVNDIEGPPNFSVFANALNNPTCFNYNDGSIDLTINGATPFDPDGVANSGDEFYTYLWEEGTSTEDRTLLDSGIYILSITDANGCNRVDSFELFNPDEVHSITITDTLSCIGICDGEAIVTPSDGVAPYTYQWSNGDTDSTATGLCYGLDTVYITDSNGCLDTNEVFIENPDTLKLSNITIDSACYQICDGQLSVTIVGGKSPYDTEWSLGGSIFNTTDTITNNDLCPGDYQLIFTDANGCDSIVIIPLIERDSFLVQDWVIDDSCYNSCTGQITVQLLNPVNLPIIYSWDNGGADTVISNLCSDTFELVIIDDRLCRDTFEFFVEPADSMYFDSIAVTHNICYGDQDGVLLINFNGGIQPLDYLWSDGQTTSGINTLNAGFYSVTVTDAQGCSLDSSNIEVSQPDSLFATPSSLENVSCFGASDGLIDIDIFGGVEPYFISWDNLIPDSTLIDTVPAGEYIYTIVDSNSCTLSDTLIIEEPDELVMSDSIIDVLCKGENTGEIHLTVTGGTAPHEYSIDNGVTFQSQSYFDNLSAGAYSIIVNDGNDCLLNSPLYNIIEPLTVLAAGLTAPNLLCFADTGTIILTVNGGTPNHSFLWGNGAVTQNLYGVGSGNYSVDILDGNDCPLTKNIIVTEPDAITFIPDITNLECFEDNSGVIDIITQGGSMPYDHSWEFGGAIIAITEDISSLMAGNYLLTVTDDNNCMSNQSFTITEPALLTSSVSGINLDCYQDNSGSIDLTVGGGTVPYTYTWTGSGGYTNNIDDPQNLAAGIYNVTVTDNNGCDAIETITITEPDLLTSSIAGTDLLCFQDNSGAINLSVNDGALPYTYTWTGPGGPYTTEDLSGLAIGTYNITVTDANGCNISGNYVIYQPIPYNETVSIIDIINLNGCYGDAIGSIDFSIVGNTFPYSYVWSNNETTANISNLSAGTYEVSVLDANNCPITYSYVILEPDALALDYTVTPTSCEEKNDGEIHASVSGGVSPITYNWIHGESTQNIFYLEKGTYTLQVEDANGCSIPLENIEVNFDGLSGCIEIPSGFTPNGDGVHDEWKIYGLSDFPNVVVQVYNRWGQEVFISKGGRIYWDGKYNGVDLPTAAYYYVIELNESGKVFNGTVTIKR